MVIYIHEEMIYQVLSRVTLNTKIYFENKLILLLSKYALNCLKVRVKTFKMLEIFFISNKCCSFNFPFTQES